MACGICHFILLCPSATADAQTASSLEARVRQRQAEVKARIEATRRKMGVTTPPSGRSSTPAPGISPEGRAWMAQQRAQHASRQAAQIRPRYKFDNGREFAYRFVLTLDKRGETSYIAGFAAFDVAEKSGSWQLLARDNLQRTSSPDVLQPQVIGVLTSMLRRTIFVDEEGEEPDADRDLPALLGNVEEWFFPPIPRSETEERAHGQTVIRQVDGRWNTIGFYNPNDRSAKGFYEWSIQPRGTSGGVLTVSDKRSLRSNDGSIELLGEGSFTFDLARGILLARQFRGTHRERGQATQVEIEIAPAPTSALDP
jgi:hypothetical protein